MLVHSPWEQSGILSPDETASPHYNFEAHHPDSTSSSSAQIVSGDDEFILLPWETNVLAYMQVFIERRNEIIERLRGSKR